MLLWILFVVLVIYLYVRVIKPHSYWKERNVTYVKPWPIFGNLGDFILRRKSFPEHLDKLYQEYNLRYFGIYQFLQPALLLKDLDLIKQITIKEFDSFVNHKEFISDKIDPLFGNNLFALRGQKWRNMRSTLSPAFTGSKMRSMYVLIAEAAEQFTNYFVEQSKTSKSPVEIEMKDVFTRFANDVIATSAFGVKVNSMKDRDNEFYMKGKDAATFDGIRSLKFFGYSLSPMLMKFFKIKIFNDQVSDFFRNLVKSTMETREKRGIVRPDMIHLLMEARKGSLKHEDSSKTNDDSTGFATVEESQVGKQEIKTEELTDDDLTAQALLFFLAGFETVSGNMCQLANELSLNPDIQEKLQKEIDDTFVDNNGKCTYDSIIKMKYLDMVVTEGLRKWPAALFTDRVCNKSYTIEPVGDEEPLKLDKGVSAWIPIFAIHRDPKYYPNPEKFDPERFSEENKSNINPLAYIPFGTGPRNCIGSRFALLELKTVFVYLLRKFNIVVTAKTQIPLRLSRTNFNLNAESGFHLGLQRRDESISLK